MARPRKPTHLKVIEGTTRPDRANPAEPDPARGVPPAPRHLRPAARAAWGRVSKLLDSMGVLTLADGLALERLCDCYADIIEARESFAQTVMIEVVEDGEAREKALAAGGEVRYVTHGKGGPMLRTRPEIAVIADADRRLRGYLADFGLTPAARSKVPSVKGSGKDPLAEYFG